MSFDMRFPRRRPMHVLRGIESARAERELALEASRRYCLIQDDLIVANAPGATVRADINNNLQALGTLMAGTSAPSTTYPTELWADRTANVLKRRNAANTGWIPVITLDESFVLSRASNTILAGSDVGKTIVATAGFTQTFTAAATLGDGWWVVYRNNSTSNVTLDPNGAETINGAATLVLPPDSGCTIYCNGSAFHTVGFVGTIGGDSTISRAQVGGDVLFTVSNTDNTNGSSRARQLIVTGGGSGGDAVTHWSVSGATDWVAGIDNSDGDSWKLDNTSLVGGNTVIKVTTGLVMELPAGQLKFPATQNPSADANTLDDYEEQTWTPGISFGGATTGITYTTRTGNYTKIGNLVYFQFVIVLSSKGSSVGTASITGLPFTASSTNPVNPPCSISWFNMTSSFVFMTALVQQGTTTADIYGNTAAGVSNIAVNDANFSNTSQLVGSGCFRA
jgi:hypothetical protein